MNLKPYLTPMRIATTAAGLFFAVLFVSWVAGQCREWRTPPAPKPLPPVVDAGTPVAGPSSAAPTTPAAPEMAVPDLTRAELEAAAKKYGLTLQPAETKRRQTAASADNSQPAPAPAPAQTFPMLLAEETFLRSPTGPGVDVAAWLPGWGERVDLRARWQEWTPPAPPAQKIPVCQSGSFFQNEAKWVKEIGVGYVYGGDKAGPGAWASAAYRGPRTGAITWGGRAFGAYSAESGAVGVGGFTASW